MADDPPEPTAFVVREHWRPGVEVSRPPGTWVTYSWLWSEHGLKRGQLDKWIRTGRVHWCVDAGDGKSKVVYRWEDIEEQVLKLKADEVERALRDGDDWQP